MSVVTTLVKILLFFTGLVLLFALGFFFFVFVMNGYKG